MSLLEPVRSLNLPGIVEWHYRLPSINRDPASFEGTSLPNIPTVEKSADYLRA
jgi:hypothetical protein